MKTAERLACKVGIHPPYIADAWARRRFARLAVEAGAEHEPAAGDCLGRWTFADGSEVVFGAGGTWDLGGAT